MRQSTKNTLYDLVRYVPSAVIPTSLGFIAVAVYTRILSPEEYGLYTLVFTTVLFTHTLAFSWLNQSTIRYYERFRIKDIQAFYSTGLFGFCINAIAITIIWFSILFLLYKYSEHRIWELLFYGPLVMMFYSGSNFMIAYLRAMRESLRYSIQTSINAVLKLLCSVAFIVCLDIGAEAVLLGIAIAGASIFISECIRLWKKWVPQIRNFSSDIFRSFAHYGLPLVGLALANVILSSSDRYLIGYFLDSVHVGIYSAGYKITETGVMLFVSFLMLASFPALIETYERGGEKEVKLLMYDLLSIFLILLLPVFAGISVLSKDIVKAVLGVSYYKAHVIVPWTAAGVFFMGLCTYYNKSFELKEKTIILLAIFAAASLLNILLNMVLIPWLGILGAAISTFFSYFGSFILSVSIGSKYVMWSFPMKTGFKALIGSSIMSLVIILLPDLRLNWASLLYKVMFGVMVYFTVIFLMDKKMLRYVVTLFQSNIKLSRKS